MAYEESSPRRAPNPVRDSLRRLLQWCGANFVTGPGVYPAGHSCARPSNTLGVAGSYVYHCRGRAATTGESSG